MAFTKKEIGLVLDEAEMILEDEKAIDLIASDSKLKQRVVNVFNRMAEIGKKRVDLPRPTSDNVCRLS